MLIFIGKAVVFRVQGDAQVHNLEGTASAVDDIPLSNDYDARATSDAEPPIEQLRPRLRTGTFTSGNMLDAHLSLTEAAAAAAESVEADGSRGSGRRRERRTSASNPAWAEYSQDEADLVTDVDSASVGTSLEAKMPTDEKRMNQLNTVSNRALYFATFAFFAVNFFFTPERKVADAYLWVSFFFVCVC